MSELHIPSPCHESWDGMTPTESGRHCAACNHAVVDVTAMPVAAGRRFLAELAGDVQRAPTKRVCIRAHRVPNGRLVAGRRRLLTPALATLLACTIAGCSGDGPSMSEATHRTTQDVLANPAPLTGTPKPRPAPADGLVVGTVHVDDVPRPPPAEPDVIKGKVVAPSQK